MEAVEEQAVETSWSTIDTVGELVDAAGEQVFEGTAAAACDQMVEGTAAAEQVLKGTAAAAFELMVERTAPAASEQMVEGTSKLDVNAPAE